MPERKISIGIELHVTLTEDQIWPDGDAPEEVTEDAVREVIIQSVVPRTRRLNGDAIVDLIRDWNLAPHATLQISVWPR